MQNNRGFLKINNYSFVDYILCLKSEIFFSIYIYLSKKKATIFKMSQRLSLYEYAELEINKQEIRQYYT